MHLTNEQRLWLANNRRRVVQVAMLSVVLLVVASVQIVQQAIETYTVTGELSTGVMQELYANAELDVGIVPLTREVHEDAYGYNKTFVLSKLAEVSAWMYQPDATTCTEYTHVALVNSDVEVVQRLEQKWCSSTQASSIVSFTQPNVEDTLWCDLSSSTYYVRSGLSWEQCNEVVVQDYVTNHFTTKMSKFFQQHVYERLMSKPYNTDVVVTDNGFVISYSDTMNLYEEFKPTYTQDIYAPVSVLCTVSNDTAELTFSIYVSEHLTEEFKVTAKILPYTMTVPDEVMRNAIPK